VPLEGGAHLYNPLGGAPLPDPPIASDLQGHSAEPIMLWTEAMVNPVGPPMVSGDWPAAPEIGHQTVKEPSGELVGVPCITSDVVARAWRVDHAKLCGKFLGHRRRTWTDADPPPLLYLWRTGWSQISPFGIALIPTWSDHPISYDGFRPDRSPIPGLWEPIERKQACPRGTFAKERMPPFPEK